MAAQPSEYATGWNDGVNRCTERMEALAERIEEAGHIAIARRLRQLVAECRGTNSGKGRPPLTAG